MKGESEDRVVRVREQDGHFLMEEVVQNYLTCPPYYRPNQGPKEPDVWGDDLHALTCSPYLAADSFPSIVLSPCSGQAGAVEPGDFPRGRGAPPGEAESRTPH